MHAFFHSYCVIYYIICIHIYIIYRSVDPDFEDFRTLKAQSFMYKLLCRPENPFNVFYVFKRRQYRYYPPN